ncbi:hypothetical protein ACT3SZ_03005 [Corynebacterium sp. AOP40-9SA-29]|uniref:hypothetical protein n=1 Tax=Corynebacterium sp. AOP40-9SA-29 TaxID=3457677 RepID=UPI0040332AB5
MGRPNYEHTKGTPPERRQIRLFPDYGRDYPLWENTVFEDTPEGPRVIWAIGNLPSAETYGLSTELSTRLRSWQQFWGDHTVEFGSWDSAENEKAWLDEGEEIARDLATEVSDFADVLPQFRT